MEEVKTKKQKLISFMKRNAYFLVAGTCFLILLLSIIVGVTINKQSTPKVEDTNTKSLTYILPLASATLGMGYSNTALQYNSTLNQWEAHMAQDFIAPTGTNVLAIQDGQVTNVYSNYLEGTVVEIKHLSGLTSKCASLNETTNVKVGDYVTQGQVIGTVANTSMKEYGTNSHLHLELLDDNNKKIDPAGYLDLAIK